MLNACRRFEKELIEFSLHENFSRRHSPTFYYIVSDILHKTINHLVQHRYSTEAI